MDADASTNTAPDPLGFWVIAGVELLALLRRAHAGEDPDLILFEEYANSTVCAP